MALQQLQTFVQILESYRGHDRMIRLASYVAMFMGGEGKTPTQVKWRTVTSEMNACRVVLRLFDDLPMFLYNLSNGFGLKGSATILKPLNFVSSILMQGFYPCEHIAWLRQKKIVNGAVAPLMLMSLFIWAISLTIEIIKSIIKLRLKAGQAQKLIKQRQLDTDRSSESSQNAQIKENLQKLASERKEEVLNIVQNVSDLMNAISWFPPGFLWAQYLPTSMNGVFGIISSTIILYRNWPAKKDKTK